MLFFLLKCVFNFMSIVICLLFLVVFFKLLIIGEFLFIWYKVCLIVIVFGLFVVCWIKLIIGLNDLYGWWKNIFFFNDNW